MSPSEIFIAARNRLLELRADYTTAKREFVWPQFEEFNWGRDYFDIVAHGSDRPAIRVVDDAGHDTALSYAELAARSTQIASFLTMRGVGPGDRVLVMLGNVIPLWEVMLAVIKLGAVMIPATTLLQGDDLADRLVRGRVKVVVTQAAFASRFAVFPDVRVHIMVGGSAPEWDALEEAYKSPHSSLVPQANGARTRADQLLLLYFTSGTTAKPKLVAHTHTSYPVGHLSTMYWLGLRPGDVHLNLSSAGWAKHAWSCFFAPFNAEATVLTYHYDRFSAQALLRQLERCRVTTFCAPPTVWRFLMQEDLSKWSLALREVASAGEPLNPEVITHVRSAWGLTIRDGFGQTETTAMIGNSPGQPIKVGSMGRPLPGYDVVLLGPDGEGSDEGEVCLDLTRRPVGLMQGYVEASPPQPDVLPQERARGDQAQLRAFGTHYRTGDIASRDADGYFTYIGRADDIFKASDYRISPFELESVLIEHVAVAEAAVVPSPDPRRLSVPKAFVVLAAGHAPDAETARNILAHVTARVSAFKRIRRLEFCDLPKTISGKIRRAELRVRETNRVAERNKGEFWEEDL
jgi:acetyl-CoA synthetase